MSRGCRDRRCSICGREVSAEHRRQRQEPIPHNVEDELHPAELRLIEYECGTVKVEP